MKNANQKASDDQGKNHIDAFRRASANVTKDQGRRSAGTRSSEKREDTDTKADRN